MFFRIGLGQRMEILLSRLDLRVSHPFHNALQVGTTCKKPGGVCVAQVVHTDIEIETRGLDCRKPDASSKSVARDRRPGFGPEQELVSAETPHSRCARQWRPATAPRTPNVRASLSFGYGLTIMRALVGECPLGNLDDRFLNRKLRRRKSMWRGLRAISSPQRMPVSIAVSTMSRCCSGIARINRSNSSGVKRPRSPQHDLGQLRVLAWIGQDQLVPDRSPEDRMEHNVIFPHRPGRQALRGCHGYPLLNV